ncbi:ABC transporter permease subunit, partial [Bradyrhizobium uaiense]|uniref:ABC transporter permease subunit n=1 Tax=Bradyrhizobium uaiense TaxID=2594946 RepID=UPI001F1DDCD5
GALEQEPKHAEHDRPERDQEQIVAWNILAEEIDRALEARRAATQDRDMVAALGVNQKWLFTSVFALGVFLAALGGALQIPR